MNITFGSIAEWVVIILGGVGVFINLRLRIEEVASTCVRKDELNSVLRNLERHIDDKFQSLRELIDEKIKHS